MAQYTREQAIKALNAANADGNIQAVNDWADYLDGLKVEAEAPKVAQEPKEQSVFAGLLDSAKAVPKLAFDTARAGVDALTVGGLDEMSSGLTAGATVAKDFITGNEEGSTFGEIYDAQMQYESQDRERFADEHAVLSTGAEVTGMILSPINKALGAVKLLQGAGKAAGVVNQGTQGIIGAVPYVFMTADGTVAERAEVALSPTVVISAASFGILGGKAISVGKDFFSKKFQKSLDVPTTANLEQSKNELYDQVAKSGIRYAPTAVNKAVNQLIGTIQKKISPDDKQAVAVFNQFKALASRNNKKGTDLKELDELQRDMWKRYNSTAGNKAEKSIILDAINSVDDLIAKHPNNSEVMKLARVANNRFKKAEQFDRINKKMMLDDSFKNAPIVDQMKTMVNKILQDPRQAKYYEPVELKAFERFLADKGTYTEQGLKSLRHLAPNMQLSALLTVGTGGASLIPQIIGQGVGKLAKGFGQRRQMSRNADLVDMVKGGRVAPNAVPRSGAFTSAPTQFVSDAVQADERNMSMLKQQY